jgi:hypothetical protein
VVRCEHCNKEVSVTYDWFGETLCKECFDQTELNYKINKQDEHKEELYNSRNKRGKC